MAFPTLAKSIENVRSLCPNMVRDGYAPSDEGQLFYDLTAEIHKAYDVDIDALRYTLLPHAN